MKKAFVGFFCHSGRLKPPRSTLFNTVLLCSMWCGLVLTELISETVLPLTISEFTASAAVIGLILALNPIFGFIAQPIVGVLSDRIRTPLGRRGFFLVICAPVVAVCLCLVPNAQWLLQLVLLIVVYQFFQDLLWGSDHPLLADIIPVRYRTLVNASMFMSAQVLGFVFNRYGLGQWLEDYGAEFLYRIAAVGQIGLVSLVALLLREPDVEPAARPKLTARRYVNDFLGDRILRRFAALGFMQFLFQNMVLGFFVLFVVRSMGLTAADFGVANSWRSLLSFALAIPFAIVAERWLPKQWTMVGGFALAVVGCWFGWQAQTSADLLTVMILFGTGMLISQVTLKPFFTEYIPRDIIGQISGAYNICLALGRTLALAGGGWLIGQWGNDYRIIWPIAMGAGIISMLIAATIPDVRHQQRRTELARS